MTRYTFMIEPHLEGDYKYYRIDKSWRDITEAREAILKALKDPLHTKVLTCLPPVGQWGDHIRISPKYKDELVFFLYEPNKPGVVFTETPFTITVTNWVLNGKGKNTSSLFGSIDGADEKGKKFRNPGVYGNPYGMATEKGPTNQYTYLENGSYEDANWNAGSPYTCVGLAAQSKDVHGGLSVPFRIGVVGYKESDPDWDVEC